MKSHYTWYNEIKSNYNNINIKNIDKIIEDEVGKVFEKVLEHCGIFKFDASGKEALDKFIKELQKEIK